MLRALLVGLLAVSATSSCGGGGDAEKVAPGGVAGTVVEVSGNVAATRNGASRTLAAGAEVFADDVIDTANGSVMILLRHNNARWAVESGQRARVDASLAWRLARQEGPAKVVDHASSAAGREGERTAADTRATSDTAEDPGAAGGKNAKASVESAAAPAEPAAVPPPSPPRAPPSPPPPPTPDRGEATGGGAERAKSGARSVVGAPGGAGEPRGVSDKQNKVSDAAPGAALTAAPESQLQRGLDARKAELARCAGKLALRLVVRVDKGAPAIELGGGAATPAVRACIERVVKQIPMAGLTGTASIELAP